VEEARNRTARRRVARDLCQQDSGFLRLTTRVTATSSLKIVDLIWLEPEFRHGRVSGDDTLTKRFFQTHERIALMERAERRRDFQLAFADFVDRVAMGTVGSGDGKAITMSRLAIRTRMRSIPAHQPVL
jgi:hypothetical protein